MRRFSFQVKYFFIERVLNNSTLFFVLKRLDSEKKSDRIVSWKDVSRRGKGELRLSLDLH
jgi:hypothetical protein